MTRYRFISHSHVARVWEKQKIIGGTINSFDAHTGAAVPGKLLYASDGWWITTEGPSPISMRVGDKQPEGISVGQRIDIVLDVYPGLDTQTLRPLMQQTKGD